MTQDFLDNQQYTELSILSYEVIYGHNYISPGGEKATDQFIETLKLVPEMRVLDIGCVWEVRPTVWPANTEYMFTASISLQT